MASPRVGALASLDPNKSFPMDLTSPASVQGLILLGGLVAFTIGWAALAFTLYYIYGRKGPIIFPDGVDDKDPIVKVESGGEVQQQRQQQQQQHQRPQKEQPRRKQLHKQDKAECRAVVATSPAGRDSRVSTETGHHNSAPTSAAKPHKGSNEGEDPRKSRLSFSDERPELATEQQSGRTSAASTATSIEVTVIKSITTPATTAAAASGTAMKSAVAVERDRL